MSSFAAQVQPSHRRALKLPGDRMLPLDGPVPLVMGVLNVTPDSFSDGGRWLRTEAAIARGLEMLDQGADLLDIGAESTRPGGGVYGGGAREVPAAEELDRLLPVLEGLRASTDVPLSVDTRKAEVAEQALVRGADMINDITGLRDPDVGAAVAGAGCPVILMHSRGSLETMQTGIHFTDVVSEVKAELGLAVERAIDSGVDSQQIVVDPGIGFGKTARHNLELLRHISDLRPLGPVLVGASRKSFIGDIASAPVDRRLPGSLAAVGWAIRGGASLVRVHDVAETVQFLALWREIESAGSNLS